MNERADNINGLIEHQMILRCSPKLAARVDAEFLEAPEKPPFEITWDDERHATVKFGKNKYPGLLLDLPTINETYKMGSKSRLFKSGDIGQVLLVHDPNDADDREFMAQQRYDPYAWTLLSGVAPPTTFIWSRIFRKQNKPPKVDFNKVEVDMGDVNVIGKEDVEIEFIHPKELETLYLKPDQSLVVDGIDVEPIPGKSVGEIIKAKRQAAEERARQLYLEEKRRKKEEKKRKKLMKDGNVEKKVKQEDLLQQSDSSIQPQWMVSQEKAERKKKLEKEIEELNQQLKQETKQGEQDKIKAEIQSKKVELSQTLY